MARRRKRARRSPSYTPGYTKAPDTYKRKRDGSSSRDDLPWSGSPPAGPPKGSMKTFNFEEDEEEARRTFFCKHCNVSLHDVDTMESHLKGGPHLMQKQRLEENELRINTGHRLKAMQHIDKVVHDRGPKHLQEQKWWQDNKGLAMKGLYCDVCDVAVTKRDQMLVHKEGKNHKRKAAKVVRHHCEICLIDVTCEVTLENHKRGRDHIKKARAIELAVIQGYGGEDSGDEDEIEVYGEAEQGNFSKEQLRKKVKELEQKVNILQSQVKKLQAHKRDCLDTHETEDFTELLEYKKWCIETHQHPKELQKPGLHCKKEREPSPLDPSTSPYGVKIEKRRSYHEENFDKEQDWRTVKPERRLGESRKEVKSEGRSWKGKRQVKSEMKMDESGRDEQQSGELQVSWHTPNVKNESTDARHESRNYKNEIDEYIESEANCKSEVNESDDDIILLE